jgi:hypothetical protein
MGLIEPPTRGFSALRYLGSTGQHRRQLPFMQGVRASPTPNVRADFSSIVSDGDRTVTAQGAGPSALKVTGYAD